jgi:hypothetical protein
MDVSLMAYSDATRREVQGTLARDQVRLFVVYQATHAAVGIVGAALLTICSWPFTCSGTDTSSETTRG